MYNSGLRATADGLHFPIPFSVVHGGLNHPLPQSPKIVPSCFPENDIKLMVYGTLSPELSIIPTRKMYNCIIRQLYCQTSALVGEYRGFSGIDAAPPLSIGLLVLFSQY
ncbi:hypothetical protein PM082_012342 [Marasmius tenuissimus]|nr:hypothetical protein PM082_012342 [Marasmius tenuissimus]